jgi:hypothetical protein
LAHIRHRGNLSRYGRHTGTGIDHNNLLHGNLLDNRDRLSDVSDWLGHFVCVVLF